MRTSGASSASGERKPPVERDIAVNRRARHNFEILETFEAGIQLMGSEVKSLRQGKIQFGDSYAMVERGELWLVHLTIAEYAWSHQFTHAPMRRRKLLMHRAQIDRLAQKTRDPGMTLVPLRLFFRGSIVKVDLGLGRGKKDYDKRETIKKRDVERELQRVRRS
jgi:SsrA-binding protein